MAGPGSLRFVCDASRGLTHGDCQVTNWRTIRQQTPHSTYANTLGLEVAADMDLGFMRWLTVCVPGDPGREILLETPGPPSMDETTTSQVADLVSKGAAGGSLFLTTADADATFETLRDRGVDITDEPSDRPYGIDFGIRDPSATRSASGRCSIPCNTEPCPRIHRPRHLRQP